jgi:PAS domain S-box-containing protein
MNRNRLFSSLRVRLILLALLAVLPALGIVFYDAARLREREVTEARADALTLSRLAASQHKEVIEATRQVLLTVAQLPEVRDGDPVACQTRLTALLEDYEAYNAFTVAGRDGDLICSTIPLNEPITVADRSWFQQAIASRDFAVGNYQLGRIDGTPIIVFAYPIFDPAGAIQGVVAASLEIDHLNQIAADDNLPEGTTLTVVDRNGTVIVRIPQPETWVGRTLLNEPLIMAIRAAGEGQTEAPDLDRVMRLYAFTPLYSTNDTGLYLAIGLPKAVAFAEADRIWMRNLLVLGLVSLLALAAAWLGSDLFVLRSVNRLIVATQRLRSDLSARTGLAHQAGELGLLARAFDELAAALEQREIERRRARQDLLALNASLEERVAERTALSQLLQHEVEERKRAEYALEGQRAFLRQVIDINPNLIFARDRPGRFTLVNQAVADVYGATVDEVIGKTDADFNPNPVSEVDHFRRDDLAVMDLFEEQFIPEAMVIDGSGRRRWLQIVKRPLVAENGQVAQLLGVATDITDRKRIEAELREQTEIIETVNRIGQMLAAELDQEKLVQAITDAATELSGAQFGAFFYNLIDDQGESYRLYTLSGAPREAFEQFPLPRNTHLFGPTFRGEGIVRLDDVKQDPRYGHNSPYQGMPSGHLPVTSYLAAPVVSRSGETVGGLFFGHAEAGVFTERTEQLIAGLVAQAAVALDNARLYREAQTLNTELEQRVTDRTSQLMASNLRLQSEIAERKQTQEALQKSNAKFEGLFESAPDAIVLINDQGRIVELNRQTEALFGYERAELLDQPVETLLPARFHTRHLQHRAAYYVDPRARQMGFGLELYGRRRDGSEAPVDITLSPLIIEDERLIISIIRDITEHKQLEAELTTVQRQLLESSEAERLRIAQELHDGPIQELYGLSFRLGELEEALSDDAGIGQLVASAVLVQQVTQNLRALCMELRPPTLAAFGLEQAIRSHANHFQGAYADLTLQLELAQDGQQLPERIRLALFRIYQEALNNIVRHAQAHQIQVRLSFDEAQVELEIRDDGCGFQIPKRWIHLAQAGHLGVVGMRERIQAIQGQLEIISSPGEGTSVQVVVPFTDTLPRRPAPEKPDRARLEEPWP